jgi:hypothetical protein
MPENVAVDRGMGATLAKVPIVAIMHVLAWALSRGAFLICGYRRFE